MLDIIDHQPDIGRLLCLMLDISIFDPGFIRVVLY